MEYSDGSDTVEPGESISAGHDDLGSATYDSDHDGVADSVIVGQGEYTVVVTDHDGDGQADVVTTYDSHGNEVDSKSADGGSGSSDDSADPSDGGGTGTDGTDGTDTGASTGSSGSDSGSDSSGSDSGDSDGSDSSDAAGGTITVVDEQGRTVEVGPATVDMDNNGEPDTAVVKGDDGSTIGYTDRNGDGEADQITKITADRQVTIMVADGNGGWNEAAHGHLDDNGEFVEDSGSSDSSSSESGSSASSAADGSSDNFVDTAVSTDAADSTDPIDITYTDASGHSYQLGAPTADFNNDGTPDTVVTTLENGTVVGYSDVDGDGLTDQVTQIDPDGTVTIGVPDGNGGWEQAATGTLGPDGEFVPSAGSSSAATSTVRSNSTV